MYNLDDNYISTRILFYEVSRIFFNIKNNEIFFKLYKILNIDCFYLNGNIYIYVNVELLKNILRQLLGQPECYIYFI